jgi:hypothetical protein
MVKAPGILGGGFFLCISESVVPVQKIAAFGSVCAQSPAGAAAGCDPWLFKSARLFTGLLQTEFLFALDLHDLGVVHSDLHRAEPQIAQGALDFTQDGGFVLTVNAAKGCAHGAAPLNGICLAVGGTAFGVGAI